MLWGHRSTWGHLWSQGSNLDFHSKMHYVLYVTYFINVTHAYASGWPLFKTYWLKFRFGITGVKRFFFTKNAVTSSIRLTLPVPLAKGAVSSFFLSFFLSNNDCFFFHMLDRMFTKLGQKHVWVNLYKTYGSKNSPDVIWGHRGQKR